MFVSCMDKHAPRKLKRISKKRAPWITKGLLNKMHRRDLIKKKAIPSNDHDMWSNLNVLETKQIMQLNKQRSATFLIT